MNRRDLIFLTLFTSLTSISACTSTQSTPKNSDLGAAKWKNFESRLLGKVIQFEFPVDIPGTNEFEFNPGMPPPLFQGDPRDNLRIVFSQSGLNVGLVHVKTKLNLSLSAIRNSSDLSALSGTPIQFGNNIWYKHNVHGLSGDRFDQRYHIGLTKEYSLFFSIRSSDIGKDGRVAFELNQIAQRILESVRVKENI